MRTYEGMFMIDSVGGEFETAAQPVRDVLDRVSANVLVMKPWDERRLAYEVKGRRRALYVLAYFQADPSAIGELHHEVQISEQIMRLMVLSADHVGPEEMNATTPALSAQARRAEIAARSEAPRKKPDSSDGEARPAAGKPDTKPDTKPDAKPGAEAEAKAEGKADGEPDAKPDAKPDAEPDAEAEGKADGEADGTAVSGDSASEKADDKTI